MAIGKGLLIFRSQYPKPSNCMKSSVIGNYSQNLYAKTEWARYYAEYAQAVEVMLEKPDATHQPLLGLPLLHSMRHVLQMAFKTHLLLIKNQLGHKYAQEQPAVFRNSAELSVRGYRDLEVGDEPPVPAHVVHQPVGPGFRDRAGGVMKQPRSRGKEDLSPCCQRGTVEGVHMGVVFDPEGNALAVLREERFLAGS